MNKKGHVVTVEPYDPRSRLDHECYLPHHPVIYPNNPNNLNKVRRVFNGAAKIHYSKT